MRRLLSGLLGVVWAVCAQDADLASRGVKVLEQRCWVCHGANLAQSGLRLDSREAALQGGTRGPAIVAGEPAQSRVVQAIRRTGELSMPPGPKLAEPDIASIEAWIAAGAAWPKAAVQSSRQAPDWWSFRKPVRPPAPAPKEAALRDWIRNPIDAFVAAEITRHQLKPAKKSDRRP